MRKYDQGSLVRVSVSAAEVYAFRQRWPGSDLPNCNVSFTFEKRNGDLVDISPSNIDGPDVVALSQDAQKYAGL